MPESFSIEEVGEKGYMLLSDCFSKLCRVPFPVEAARADTVMHYETEGDRPTLVFRCNAAIHAARVKAPNALKVCGISTRKYAMVKLDQPHDVEELSEVLNYFEQAGYSLQDAQDRLYLCWDERA